MGKRLYIEAIFCDTDGGNALRTGVGAMGKTARETRALFDAARKFGRDDDDPEAVFMLDLRDSDTIYETLCSSRDAYTMITGEPALAASDYERSDRIYYGAVDPNLKGPCTYGMSKGASR